MRESFLRGSHDRKEQAKEREKHRSPGRGPKVAENGWKSPWRNGRVVAVGGLAGVPVSAETV